MTRSRPHRKPLSLLSCSAVVALAWNITYLFRLGFERWLCARPAYDGWVLARIVAADAAAFIAFRVALTSIMLDAVARKLRLVDRHQPPGPLRHNLPA